MKGTEQLLGLVPPIALTGGMFMLMREFDRAMSQKDSKSKETYRLGLWD